MGDISRGISDASAIDAASMMRGAVKAEMAGSTPVTSASTNSGLTVQGEERREFGSWLHRHDLLTVDHHLLEQRLGQPVPLLLRRQRPTLRHVGDQLRQPGQPVALAVVRGVERRQLAPQPVALGQARRLRQVAEQGAVPQPG